jgi:protein-L-isoaspartate(D-aspartate) O-methyltransferase
MANAMLATIEAHYRDTCLFTGLDALTESVRDALQQVDRRAFVPPVTTALAESDSALPIGCGQTISQPFVVALMTQLLAPQPFHRVLEIGTGSGYQAAVLAHLVAELYSLEIIDNLAEAARDRLQRLGYHNATVLNRDGYYGLPELGPFDGIVITAALEDIPPPLLKQLRCGGRLVAPLGPTDGIQQLVIVEHRSDGWERRAVLPVNFVPFTRAH